MNYFFKIMDTVAQYHVRHFTDEMILDKASTILQSKLNSRDVMDRPSTVKTFLKAKLSHRKNEHFVVLFLNNKHHLICYEEVFHGTVDGSSVHVRPIAQKCLEYNAAAIIIAHNHPSGVETPSDADNKITRHVIKSLAVFDVRVLDHFIVADNQCYSFAEHRCCGL